MNRTFKTIWSHAQNAWVAVSEVAHAKGKTSSAGVLAGGVLLLASQSSAFAACTFNTPGIGSTQVTVTASGTDTTQSCLTALTNSVGAVTGFHYLSVKGNGTTTQGNYNNDGATGVNSVAIGPNATTKLVSLMAPINDAPANINNLHDVATGTPTASVAIGNEASAAAGSSIAIGDRAKTLLGWNYDLTKPSPHPSVANVYGIAIGTGATAIGNNMVIGGQGAENALFAGQGTIPNNINNITLGNGAGANMKGNENIILGYQAGVGMTGAVGAGANIVIGKSAGLNASGDNTRIAIGENAGQRVTGSGNIGVGSQAGSNVGKMAGSQYASLTPTGGWQGWGWLYCMEGAATCPKVLPAPWNPNILLDNGGSLDGVSNVGLGNLAGFDTHGSVNVGIGFKGGLTGC